MEVSCNTCERKIDAENINVGKDMAYCIICENLTSLSSLLESTPSKNFDISSPVSGTTVNDQGFNWVVSCSHRNWMALFFVPFTLVWAGGSLSGIYGTQIMNGEFDLVQSLFGLPFLMGSVVLTTLCLMNLFGRTVVSVESEKALIFMGVGSIGWYRRFDWSSIDRVIEITKGQYRHISLEGAKRLGLGWGLSAKKQYYIANMLRTKLKN